MSNFLNKFEDSNYQKNKDTKETIKEIKKEETKETTTVKTKAIISPEHEIEIDTDFHNKQKRKHMIYAALGIAAILLIVLLIKLSSLVAVKNLVGMSLSDAKTWALKNDIELEIATEYNFEYNQDIIYYQDIVSGKKISKNSILYIKVSNGLDPNEKIAIPDFKSMTSSEIRSWVTEKKAINTYITGEYHNTISSGEFIKIEFNSSEVDETNYTRRDSMTIYVSKGKEAISKNIEVPDFISRTKAQAQEWATENKVTITFTEVSSDKEIGIITGQSKEAGSYVSASDKITLKVSKGPGVTVPDYSKYSKEDALSVSPGIMVNIKTKYHSTILYGGFISQSIASGKKLYDDNKNIDVTYSLGKPYIDDLTNQSEKGIPEYFYDLNSKGANFKYTVTYIKSSEDKGTIISQSKANEYLEIGATIDIVVSKGPQ